MSNPPIVINAFQRPDSLKRLLNSLQKASIPDDVDLWFSIEFGAHPEVLKMVSSFDWKFGKKTILEKEQKLGLVGHFLACGDLTSQLGTIVYLEDDLYVGAGFYSYVLQVLDAYGEEDRIGGFSLNALWFNGYLHLPFKPIQDGNPSFFLQVAWYQGQIYTAAQWQHFKEWLVMDEGAAPDLLMHDSMINFHLEDDWFPLKSRYLVETGRFYCFPREAQVVNFGDAGTHFANKTDFFMTEASLDSISAVFKPFEKCLAVYDSFFEILPDRLNVFCPHLRGKDVEIDLNGTKDLSRIQKEYLISPKQCKSPISQYALEMRPHEMNIAEQISGDYFSLGRLVDFESGSVSMQKELQRFRYFHRHKLGLKKQLILWLKNAIQTFVKV